MPSLLGVLLSKNPFYPLLTSHMDTNDHQQDMQVDFKMSRIEEVMLPNSMGASASDNPFLSDFLYNQCLQLIRKEFWEQLQDKVMIDTEHAMIEAEQRWRPMKTITWTMRPIGSMKARTIENKFGQSQTGENGNRH